MDRKRDQDDDRDRDRVLGKAVVDIARGLLAVIEGGVAVVLAIVLAYGLFAGLLSFAGPQAREALHGGDWGIGQVVTLILAQAASFASLAVALRRLRCRRPAPLGTGGWRGGTRRRLVVAGAAVGLLAVVVGFGIEALQGWLGFPVREQEWIVSLVRDGGSGLLVALPLIVVVGPLAEELFFRGYLYSFLQERSGIVVGATVSALYFALIHLNPSGLPSYLFLGLVFAWTVHRWRSVLVAAVAHGVNNLVAVGLLYVTG